MCFYDQPDFQGDCLPPLYEAIGEEMRAPAPSGLMGVRDRTAYWLCITDTGNTDHVQGVKPGQGADLADYWKNTRWHAANQRRARSSRGQPLGRYLIAAP